MSVDKVEDSEVTKALPDASSDIESDVVECIACSTKHPRGEVVELSCADDYCHSCLEKLFETAMKDETMYPPSCCGQRIPLKLVQKRLPKPTIYRFKMKQPEFDTKNKTYCHKPKCSAFIAPHSIHNDQAICQRCRAVTCNKCKDEWHFGPCMEGSDASFFEYIRSTTWKRCPECKRIVEKANGCNNIV